MNAEQMSDSASDLKEIASTLFLILGELQLITDYLRIQHADNNRPSHQPAYLKAHFRDLDSLVKQVAGSIQCSDTK